MKTVSSRVRRRAAKGTGRLYKRDANGHEHPADWPGAGVYWLAYSIPDPAGGLGQRVRQPLRDPNGHPITDRDQAEAERRRIMAPYQTGDAVETLRVIQSRLNHAEARHAAAGDAARPPLSIKDAWAAYLRAPGRPDSGPATMDQYAGHWDRLAAWLARVYPDKAYLRDMTPGMGAEYAADLAAAGLSPNRYNKHVSFLHLLFRVLADEARIESNPFERVGRKVLRTHNRRELTVAELRAILGRASGDLGVLLLIGAATGLRLGDCCTLTWGEVDLTRGIIRRVPNKTARRGGKPVLLGIPATLHERLSSIRRRTGYVLPVMAARYERDPSLVTNAVKAHVLDCGIDVHAPGTGERIRRDGDGNPERDGDGHVITEETRKPAVVEVGFHSLRHTWVSLHAAAGTPGAVIQSSVGHANPAMTAHYTHVGEDTARSVAMALPALLPGDTGTGPERNTTAPDWRTHVRALADRLNGHTWKAVKADLATLAASV
jgi:integrase